MSEQSHLMTAAELMAFLNIGRMTAYELMHSENGLKPYTIRVSAGGKALRVTREGVLLWIAENQGKVDAQDFRAQDEEDVPVPLQMRRASGGRR